MSHHLEYRVSNPSYHTLNMKSGMICQPNLMFDYHKSTWKPLVMRPEVFDWLKETMGWGEFNPVKNHDWKRSTHKRYSYKTIEYGDFTDHIFEFKHRYDAMLFKLTFAG